MLRAEARGRRVALLVTAAAVVLGTTLVHLAHPAGRVRGDAREALPGAAAALAFLVVGLDLFARDGLSAAWALVLRTPSAFRTAFLARTALLLLAGAAAAALAAGGDAVLASARPAPAAPAAGSAEGPSPEAAARSAAPSVEDRFASEEAARLVRGGPLAPPRTAALLALALAAGLWIAVGSTWVPAGAAASLVGAGALALLLAPYVALHTAVGWAVGTRRSDVVVLALLAAALGAVVLLLSYRFGRRHLARGRPGFLAGAATGVAVSLAGAAALASNATAWTRFGPSDEGVRFSEAFLGEGGRFLFVRAHRGRTWVARQGFADLHPFDGPAPEGPGTPSRVFALDLERGEARPLGELGERVAPALRDAWRFGPHRWLVVGRDDGDGRVQRWVDGRTAQVRLVSGRRGIPDEAIPWAREVARAASPHRDPRGRPAWAFLGRLEVEGEPHPRIDPHRTDVPWHNPVPGGWRVSDSGRTSFLSLETGERRPLAEPTLGAWDSYRTVPVGSTTSLVRGSRFERGAAASLSPWILFEHDLLSERPAGLGRDDEVLFPLLDGRALVADSATGDAFLYQPRTEKRTPVARGPGVPERLDGAGAVARRSDGTVLFQALRRREDGFVVSQGGWVRLDPVTATLRVAASFPVGHPIVALLDDDSTVVVEGDRTVVRHGPAPSTRTVLWPRGARP
jgi:hypothetical protein